MLLSIANASMKRISGLQIFVILVLLGSIAVLNSCGGGGGGGGGVVLPPAASSPAGAIGVSAVAGDSQVTIGWDTVSSATSYNIYRSLVSGQMGTLIASVDASLKSYIDKTNLTNNTTYYYMVDALNGATDLGISSQVSATPTSGTPVIITINGTVQYQDKEYGVNGFTGNQPYKAVRYAEVDLVPSSGTIISTVTDSNGMYTISTAPSTTISVYVRVKSTATIPGASPIAVMSLSNDLYGPASNNLTPSGNANVNISIPSTSVGGAFNMLDVFTNGFNFVHNMSGTYPPSLNGFWQVNNSNGTYYCSGICPRGDGIYVLNSSSDTDEYDDDVLYHEFGHFTAAHFSQDDSQGGAHMLTNNDLDMRLAWSEGWGDAMPGNIKMWLNSANPNLLSSSGVPLTEYVDTVPGGAGIAIDMDNPESSYPWIPSKDFSYACGEVAVAKILLESNKSFGMDHVWSVLTDFKLNPPPPATPVNLELFWDRWNSKGYSSLQSIFNDRLIFYSDLYTSDTFSTATPLALNTQQTHYIYPAGDFDLVSFNANTNQLYTVATSTLLNGADTYIEVYDQNQLLIPIAANDNANGYSSSLYAIPSDDLNLGLCDQYQICHDNRPDVLRSSKQFQATSSGPYYVKIYSSPNRPISAGRYGTYTLTITSP